MSKYTTGELAKLVGVSVRTVQYYDVRGILLPSELSEGGRRLYSEDDVKKMRIICFLRDVGIPINGIAKLFSDNNPKGIVSILLDEQEGLLREELAERQSKLRLIEGIKRELTEIDGFSVESLGDIANIMKQKNKLTKMRVIMIATGIPISLLQITSVILWIASGAWWLFAIWACLAVAYGFAVSAYYFGHLSYICPECHEVFKPKLKESFWAYHTPRMRRLTCPSCGRKGLCVEIYSEKEKKSNG